MSLSLTAINQPVSPYGRVSCTLSRYWHTRYNRHHEIARGLLVHDRSIARLLALNRIRYATRQLWLCHKQVPSRTPKP